MNDTLLIQNFSIFKKIQIEFKKFNVIIGPQASGKSLIAKLYYFFTVEIRSALRQNLVGMKKWDDFENDLKEKFIEIFPRKLWGSGSFVLARKCGNVELQIRGNKNIKLIVPESVKRDYEDVLNKIQQRVEGKKDHSHDEPDVNFSTMIYTNKLISNFFSSNLFFKAGLFIPANRSIFSMVQTNVFSFLLSEVSLDPFIKRFGSYLGRVKNRYRLMERGHKIPEDRILSILKGRYKKENDEEFIIDQAGKAKIPLINASSGQQEVLPILLSLNASYMTNSILTIEEPEAHIFPRFQYELMNLLADFFNYDYEEKCGYVITTHSPYILSSLNNIIARCLVKKNKEKYKADDFVAYLVENGAVTSLIDSETHLIRAESIDDVSEDIAVEFDKLLEKMV